jgi:hypothetical protein
MYISERLIEELIDSGIITDTLCDRIKAKLIIRDTLIKVHEEAVLSTVMAGNKKSFVAPPFLDL